MKKKKLEFYDEKFRKYPLALFIDNVTPPKKSLVMRFLSFLKYLFSRER